MMWGGHHVKKEKLMSTQRTSGAYRESDDDSLGLMANGSSGQWEVSVDETTSGPDRWFLQIEGPTCYFSIEIPTPAMVQKVFEFLGEHNASGNLVSSVTETPTSLTIGNSKGSPVILTKDDEYTDRYFLLFGQKDAHARFTIADQDLKAITEALRQAIDDIDDNE